MPENRSPNIDLSGLAFESVTDSAQLENAICRAAFDFWLSLPDPKLLQTQHFLEAVEVVPYAVALDWHPDKEDFQFRFVGQQVADVSEQDLTGHLLFQEGLAPLTEAFCREFLARRTPLKSNLNYEKQDILTVHHFDETVLIPGKSDIGNDRLVIAHGLRL